MKKKKIKKSIRGLTFSLEDEGKIGTKFRYFINVKNNEIVIVEDENGKGTVSRKKCGKKYKPLYDIRSKEVKKLVSKADYLEVEENNGKIVVHAFTRVKHNLVRNNIVRIEDVLCCKAGEIIVDMAAGGTNPQYLFGKPTLYNDEYFSYLERNHPRWEPRKEKKKLQKVYDVVSLFSGAGLLDNAFKDPQIRFVYGVDFSEDACETYKANIGGHIVCDDIRNIDASSVPDCDIIIGGPCCQGYSNANRVDINKLSAKTKRLLIDDYVRITKEKKPKVFVIENVPQLLTREDGLFISKVINGLPEYEITCKILADNNVGGFTMRKRAIVIGSRIGKIELPDATFTTVKTVKDALKNVDATWFNYNDVTLPKPSTKLAMSYVPQGGNWKDIPESIHKFGPSTQSNTYRRLAWDELSPTITNWRKCILIHPEKDRILSVAEAAALMGLDKSFKILGKSLDSRQQAVGNGVTQAIGRFVKEHVLEKLNANNKILSFA